MNFIPLACDILEQTGKVVVASPHKHRLTSLNWFVNPQVPVTVSLLFILNVLVVQMGEEYYHARDYSKALM